MLYYIYPYIYIYIYIHIYIFYINHSCIPIIETHVFFFRRSDEIRTAILKLSGFSSIPIGVKVESHPFVKTSSLWDENKSTNQDLFHPVIVCNSRVNQQMFPNYWSNCQTFPSI